MSLPCIPCAEPQVCVEGLDDYSLQDDLYSTVYNCPPGVYCGSNNFLFLLCCDGNQLRVDFTAGMSLASRNRLIDQAVAECERRRLFCDFTDCLVPPCDVEYWYSSPASCTVYCPDGTPFTYTVPAGIFLAKTQAEADAAAKAYACETAELLKFCLPSLAACACVGVAFSAVLPASPSKPLQFVLASGTLPPGITFPAGFIANGVLRLTGTPTAVGNYTFVIRALDSIGNSIEKSYNIIVGGITTAALPNFTVGTPYSQQLSAFGVGSLVFTIASGSLPDGLSLSLTGLISGTPTASAVTSSVTFSVRDLACPS